MWMHICHPSDIAHCQEEGLLFHGLPLAEAGSIPQPSPKPDK